VRQAEEIKVRAERRLGEMIREQKRTVGLNTGGWTQHHAKSCGAGVEPQDAPPTLADAGISKKLSSRSQAIAGIPEDDFEATLAEHREERTKKAQGTNNQYVQARSEKCQIDTFHSTAATSGRRRRGRQWWPW
jgi:hypothetical protein